MSRRPIDGWVPYLDDVLALWNELGPEFRVGGMAREQLVELRDQLAETLGKLNALHAQVGLAADGRDTQIGGIQDFAVKFRSAVVAEYGAQSSQAKRVPRVEAARVRSASPADDVSAPDADS